ncbi:MAG: YceI family protein [Undibacterium sp.]|jgi:polyisoprenoid-binding protein YceI|nr:YceI family protein [Undibacterium sp.]MDO8702957.1 YceI family protein [Undibacterium sp.]MDO9194109.1 YceI family protein [Undibacterium sp.]
MTQFLRLPANTKTIVAIVTLAIAVPALAAIAKLDTAKSSVGIVFKQMNVPVDAKFKKFTAAIDYNSAKPEASKASVDIDVSSFDLGDPEYNKEVLKKEWFNAAQFPKATFTSTSMKAGASGKLDVTGNLTIKGKTSLISFPLSVKKEGNNQLFEGSLPIKRLAFNIGEGEWKDTGMVADEVIIKFHVITTQ